MAQQVNLRPYKYTVNGKEYFGIAPDYNLPKGTGASWATPEELQAHIEGWKGTDQWSQDYLAGLKAGLKKIQAGESEYALGPDNVLTTKAALAQQATEGVGKVNIGTPEKPLWVPAGSPAETLIKSPTEYAKQYGQFGLPSPPTPTPTTTPVNTGKVGDIGTWYDPTTGLGYSGPKKKETDVPADPTTGKPLTSTSTKEAKLAEIEAQINAIKSKVPAIQAGVEELTKAKTTVLPEPPAGETKPNETSITNITTGAGTISDLVNYWMQRDKDIQKELDEARTQQKSWIEKLTGQPEKTREERLQELRTQYGIPEKLDLLEQQNIKIANLQGEINKLDVDRQTEIDKVYTLGMPMPYIEGKVNEINRTYNSQKAYLSAQLGAEAAVAQAYAGNLDAANKLVSDSIDAFTWDYTEQTNRWKFAYTYYTDLISSLSSEQRDIMDNAYREAVRQEENAREDLKYKENLWTGAAEKGIYVPFTDLAGMTTDEAAKWYAENVSAKVAEEQAAKAAATAAPVLFTGGSAIENAFNEVVNSPKFDAKDRARYTALMQQYISAGDTARARDLINTLVYQGSNVTTQNQLTGSDLAVEQLDAAEKALDAYIAAGGNTNILTGTIENIFRKLGETTDPKLVTAATMLRTSLFNYRKAMTGVQFSYPEAQQYADLWGKTTNTVTVNKAAMAAMKNAMRMNKEVVIRNVIGATNYNQLYPETTQLSPEQVSEVDTTAKTIENLPKDNVSDWVSNAWRTVTNALSSGFKWLTGGG